MLYLIDANNLAGAMHLLNEKDFDKALIDIILNSKFILRNKFVLVFDSNDIMGDRIKENNLTIIYTPRDSYYKNADDKVLEEAKKLKNDFTLVTDDLDLTKKVKDLKLKNFNIKKASSMAKELLNAIEVDLEERTELDDDEMDEITEEFREIWK